MRTRADASRRCTRAGGAGHSLGRRGASRGGSGAARTALGKLGEERVEVGEHRLENLGEDGALVAAHHDHLELLEVRRGGAELLEREAALHEEVEAIEEGARLDVPRLNLGRLLCGQLLVDEVGALEVGADLQREREAGDGVLGLESEDLIGADVLLRLVDDVVADLPDEVDEAHRYVVVPAAERSSGG